jgi:Thioredoxin
MRGLSRKAASGWEDQGLEVLRTKDFDARRLQREGVYAVCFGAIWCGPTRVFVPKFVARNGRVPATLAIADITDWDDPLWDTFEIKITPTMMVFQNGALTGRFDGRRFRGLGDADLDKLQALLGTLGASFSPSAGP